MKAQTHVSADSKSSEPDSTRPLHEAIRADRIDELKRLIEQKANIEEEETERLRCSPQPPRMCEFCWKLEQIR